MEVSVQDKPGPRLRFQNLMSMQERQIAMVARKYKLGEEPKDRDAYLRLSDEERLGIVEEIRREYHGWDDETEPRLQRVYRVLKQE